MTFRDSLDSCSYCSHVVNRGTEAAFVDFYIMRLQKSGDYRKGADPGTHRVLFVEHDTETEVPTNPHSVPQFLVALDTDSHISCNIC